MAARLAGVSCTACRRACSTAATTSLARPPTVPCPPTSTLPAESLSWNPNPSGVPSRLGAAGTGAAGATGSLGQSTDDVKRLCWQRVLHRAGISPHMLGML